jgi:geranylgeranyl pyrophosphate synthase
MFFLESASPQTAETLERIVTGDETSDDVINDIVDQIRASGALDRAESSANDYIVEAESRLDVVKDRETRGFLRDLLHVSIVRSA